VEKRIAVREGSGALVDFPVNRVRSATLVFVDARGNRCRSVRRSRRLTASSAAWWAMTAWSGSRILDATTKSK
jgi:hypothetical protein